MRCHAFEIMVGYIGRYEMNLFASNSFGNVKCALMLYIQEVSVFVRF